MFNMNKKGLSKHGLSTIVKFHIQMYSYLPPRWNSYSNVSKLFTFVCTLWKIQVMSASLQNTTLKMPSFNLLKNEIITWNYRKGGRTTLHDKSIWVILKWPRPSKYKRTRRCFCHGIKLTNLDVQYWWKILKKCSGPATSRRRASHMVYSIHDGK